MNIKTIKPVGFAEKTTAVVHEEDTTYNEAGYTYNQAGVTYGGVYGAQEVRPMVSLSKLVRPTILTAKDVGATQGQQQRTLGRGMLIGMLGMTYSEDIIVTG